MENLLNEVKQYRKEQAELLDWNKHNGHPITVSFDEGGLNACDKIIAIIERAKAKADSTSEKDLRVCSVNGSFTIIQSEKLPHRFYKQGNVLIKVTYAYKFNEEQSVYFFERIENNVRKGGYIAGFRLFDDMIPVSRFELRDALLNCH